MAYVVSARKYRPQKFEDVVGQSHVTSTIKNALLNDKLAHAFLFCGPRGVGKTTCARLLAKVVNMDDPKAAIQDGSYADSDIDISLNIAELDAASNNSVENIRSLIEQVRIPPAQGKVKVFIIDEVHMLSTQAFNAFLKTLEEPPPYAIFILATTERHKILPTILSRCQLYDFRRIQVPDIIKQLESVADREQIKAEHDALYVIAEKADGAMRDALSIFDRIASGSSGKITLQDVVENLNILDFDYFFRAVDMIMQEDASGLLLLHEEVLNKGFEGDLFINGLAGHMRYLLYCKEEPTQKMLQMSETLKTRYIDQSKAIFYGTILTALNLANQCDIAYPRAKDKRLHVEIALLKICFAERQAYPSQRSSTSSEKKTPEVTPIKSTPQESPAAAQKTIPKAVSQTPVVKESTPQSPVIKESAPQNIAPKKVVPTRLQTPSKLSSVDDLLSAAATELAQVDNKSKEVTLDGVKQEWENYTKEIASPTLKGVLTNVVLEVNDGQLHTYVPTNIAREEIQQETELYTRLRKFFNQNDLVIEVKVDRSHFPDMEDGEVKKLVTPRQKYDHLKAINPMIDQFIDRLDLKLDQ